MVKMTRKVTFPPNPVDGKDNNRKGLECRKPASIPGNRTVGRYDPVQGALAAQGLNKTSHRRANSAANFPGIGAH